MNYNNKILNLSLKKFKNKKKNDYENFRFYLNKIQYFMKKKKNLWNFIFVILHITFFSFIKIYYFYFNINLYLQK